MVEIMQQFYAVLYKFNRFFVALLCKGSSDQVPVIGIIFCDQDLLSVHKRGIRCSKVGEYKVAMQIIFLKRKIKRGYKIDNLFCLCLRSLLYIFPVETAGNQRNQEQDNEYPE